MAEKVTNIIDYLPDPSSMNWDLKAALMDTIKRIDQGAFPNKGIVIGLVDDNNIFGPRFSQAGILTSQCIALLQVLQCYMAQMLMEER